MESSRASPTHRPREDGLTHPADASKTNLADALALPTRLTSFPNLYLSGLGIFANRYSCMAEDVLTAEKQALLEEQVASVMASFQSMLSIERVQVCSGRSRRSEPTVGVYGHRNEAQRGG